MTENAPRTSAAVPIIPIIVCGVLAAAGGAAGGWAARGYKEGPSPPAAAAPGSLASALALRLRPGPSWRLDEYDSSSVVMRDGSLTVRAPRHGSGYLHVFVGAREETVLLDDSERGPLKLAAAALRDDLVRRRADELAESLLEGRPRPAAPAAKEPPAPMPRAAVVVPVVVPTAFGYRVVPPAYRPLSLFRARTGVRVRVK